MKILDGIYKGVELTAPDDGSARPTVDHLKKHIRRLTADIKKEIVWDLFAGTGGVGLEFLSGGSQEVVFVEELKRVLACLKLNIAECNLKNPSKFSQQNPVVVQSLVESFLKTPTTTKSPNLIFLDPPYGKNWMEKITPILN